MMDTKGKHTITTALAVAALALGCSAATLGRFPASFGGDGETEVTAAISAAERDIELAMRSGADSLAGTELAAARANLAAARAARGKSDRIATVRAHEASADAAYARAVAEREAAERARIAAQQALEQVGSEGTP